MHVNPVGVEERLTCCGYWEVLTCGGSTVVGWIHPCRSHGPRPCPGPASASVTIEVGGKGPCLGWRSSYKVKEPSWCGTLGTAWGWGGCEVKGSRITRHNGPKFPKSKLRCRMSRLAISHFHPFPLIPHVLEDWFIGQTSLSVSYFYRKKSQQWWGLRNWYVNMWTVFREQLVSPSIPWPSGYLLDPPILKTLVFYSQVRHRSVCAQGIPSSCSKCGFQWLSTTYELIWRRCSLLYIILILSW